MDPQTPADPPSARLSNYVEPAAASEGELDFRHSRAIENARAAGVTVTPGADKIYVNYDYTTRRAADELGDELGRAGFGLTWNSSMIDGDDEEWTLISNISNAERWL